MSLKVTAISELVGGNVVQGSEEVEVTGLASLNEAGAQDVSFLGNEKYYQDFLATKAGVVIVPAGLSDQPAGATLIEVENPSFAFGLVVKQMAEGQRSFKPGIHPAAYVDESAQLDASKVCVRAGAVIEAGAVIGDGTEIAAGVVIGEDCQIGRDCLLHANTTVRERCVIGDRVILQPGCVIGSDGYGFELVDGRHVKVDQVGIVVLEDDVEIGSNSCVDRARFGKTVIGEGTKIDNLVQIGHNVITGKHCLMVSQVGVAGSSKLGNYVVLAAKSGVTGHVEVADQVVIAGASGVTKSITEKGTYYGMPARPFRDEQKKLIAVERLPKLMKEFKQLKKQVEDLASDSE
ncbi:UDP-3-O-(3-hydroxymyristoyl)glucosamine N-acyltransferase [Persicirhabdus sediminis]|uniref:UDP-3-O-acylglucosamine N-acyltransferase n=1 Tax=Persicirhabdus sediminis TaxID=454144 RepID=A0A8J7SJT1_9BACT|nr:UDP-3-O-(3-hydroxymyristoyl)glucosamine N-acyltransferase [Persicirhabdus sediminis]MBK1791564.1 UDP-3-O-(3-hydroxymyristoyl)glucosamine N-acyltransferase [Persicirhabdus sediminis]